MVIERRPQLANLRTLAGDKSESLQSVPKEGPNRLLLVGDANTKPHSPPTKVGRRGLFFGCLARHYTTPLKRAAAYLPLRVMLLGKRGGNVNLYR
jgi:hypothetical protein